jgi:hypothetical protein
VHIVMRLTLPDRVSATMLEISCFVTGDRFYKCSTTTSWAHLNLTTGCGTVYNIFRKFHRDGVRELPVSRQRL